uniref:Uncharacterized protein n=1 Tax=Arundo donax TaxID=35708 RepID=A0A0A8Z5U7_ARUDO
MMKCPSSVSSKLIILSFSSILPTATSPVHENVSPISSSSSMLVSNLKLNFFRSTSASILCLILFTL